MSSLPAPRPQPRRRPPRARRRALGAGAAALLLSLTGVAAAPAAAPAAASAAAQDSVRQDSVRQASGQPGLVQGDVDPALAARLDAAITAAMKKAGMPGVTVGLWTAGRGDYVKSFGLADTKSGTPMKTDLYTRIGSVTKTFTVTAVLQLVDEGRVRLDDPISQYVDGVPGGAGITVRQLASMRSGLYNYTEDKKFLDALRADPQREYTPQQLLDFAFAHPANFPPGTAWEYSNTNTILLGLLIEQMSGQPLDGYLRHHVLDPLKLTDTALPSADRFPEPHAQGYTNFTPDGSVTTATGWNPSWAWAAGGITSTLEDLHTWAPALAEGRLLSPATQAQRLRMRPVGAPGVSYGLGILQINGWLGHNGELPGYETIAAHLPQEKATRVVLVNSDADDGNSYSTLIGKAVTEIATPAHVWELPAPPQVGENH
ncbi:serine hydrolase domain-containing protein [Streptomyces sp. cmx-4-9]|uniref:serine hydrolase domain-containing protein n=1 Tax=Streptomyces sp. cmx-4-9 TaxID=2790941 RepID=UPI00398174DE